MLTVNKGINIVCYPALFRPGFLRLWSSGICSLLAQGTCYLSFFGEVTYRTRKIGPVLLLFSSSVTSVTLLPLTWIYVCVCLILMTENYSSVTEDIYARARGNSGYGGQPRNALRTEVPDRPEAPDLRSARSRQSRRPSSFSSVPQAAALSPAARPAALPFPSGYSSRRHGLRSP